MKHIKNILTFLVIFLIIGEVLVRLKQAVNDIPQRQIDQYGIQKYIPNQKGFWRGGTHAWHVNELGWPGVLPKDFNNLITIIGDSFIENFMNPENCHQSEYLKQNLERFNFLEAGRSGVSFIESMEISKQLIKYKPITHLIYVKDNDFYESLVEVAPEDDITQYSLKNDALVFGKMKSPGLKKLLYNWKFMYYLYNKKYIVTTLFKTEKATVLEERGGDDAENIALVSDLLDRVKLNYNVSKITLVFHPNSNTNIIEKCKAIGFHTIVLNSDNDERWSFKNDNHWTCYGHERAALQISKALLPIISNN
ncbi:hypothetical protein ACFFVB_07040 [Formosa undariae]|uniref:SGNH/GDSL hydrolase family protein n=1 Tax=Formosa undariae TaxID=1325436 RepID=A0ABV5F085_9FLAO